MKKVVVLIGVFVSIILGVSIRKMEFKDLLEHYMVPLTTVFSNIMIGLVPIVAGWMRYYSKNIKVIGRSYTYDVFYGHSYSLKLENKTLRTFIIDKIKVFVNNKQFFIIDLEKQNPNFEKRTLLPFKQLVVETRWTNSSNTQYERLLSTWGVKLEIRAGEETITVMCTSLWQKVKYKKPFIKFFVKKYRSNLNNQIVLKRITHNDNVVSENVKFAINIFKDDGVLERTILVNDDGFMNDSIFINVPKGGYVNILPKEKLKSSDTLINYLKDNVFNASHQKFMVETI
jgi:hypothetical protein